MSDRDTSLLDRAFETTVTQWGSSRFAAYRQCPRKHHLRFELGVVPRARKREWDEPLSYFDVGRLVHSTLGYARLCALHSVPIDPAAPIEYARGLPGADKITDEIDEAERLISAYFAHWGTDNAGLPEGHEILEVESLYESESPRYSGRLDCLVRAADRVAIVDTKTRGRALPSKREAYVRGLRTNPQFVGLSWLVREALELDYAPPLIVDAVIKSVRVPKFDRVTVQFEDRDLDMWRSAHEEWTSTIGQSCAPNLSECAPEIGAPCTYFDYCHGSDETRERLYELKGSKG